MAAACGAGSVPSARVTVTGAAGVAVVGLRGGRPWRRGRPARTPGTRCRQHRLLGQRIRLARRAHPASASAAGSALADRSTFAAFAQGSPFGGPALPLSVRRLTNLPSSTGGILTDTSSPSGFGSLSSSIGTMTATASARTMAPTRRRRARRRSSSRLISRNQSWRWRTGFGVAPAATRDSLRSAAATVRNEPKTTILSASPAASRAAANAVPQRRRMRGSPSAPRLPRAASRAMRRRCAATRARQRRDEPAIDARPSSRHDPVDILVGEHRRTPRSSPGRSPCAPSASASARAACGLWATSSTIVGRPGNTWKRPAARPSAALRGCAARSRAARARNSIEGCERRGGIGELIRAAQRGNGRPKRSPRGPR